MRTFSSTIRTARKRHECNSCLWINEGGGLREFFWNFGKELTFRQKRELVKAINENKGMIKPGQRYQEWRGIGCEGRPETIRSIPEIHAICLKFDIYDDAC